MDRQIITYGLDERDLPEAASSYASLWIEDLIFSGQYWSLRAADLSLSALRWLRTKPAAIIAGFLIVAGSALALNVHNKLSYSRRMSACLDVEAISNGEWGAGLKRCDTCQRPAA